MNEIKRSGIAGPILFVLGKANRAIELQEWGIRVWTRSSQDIPFREVTVPLKLKRWLWFSVISLQLADGSNVDVAGVERADAQRFIQGANSAWRRSISDLFDEVDQDLVRLSKVVERLSAPRRYPAACLLEPYVAEVNALFSKVPNKVPEGTISIERERALNAVSTFYSRPEEMRDTAVNSFVEAELKEQQAFFDGVEANPLTPEQRLAVLTDEDATLVLAGAGSGKTSVIVSKAAYLIERGMAQPSEILLMAFGAKAAEEMANRIEERCGTPVDTKTFHALGYSIINEVEGQAPALAPHASDEVQFYALLRNILEHQIAKLEEIGALLFRWFAEFFWPYRSDWDFETLDEYYQYVEAHELRTLQGELVRSFEECEIANWLYLNGIAYEYEPTYEHDLPENKKRAYTPDFRLKDSGVYIEHFGVRKERRPDGGFRLTTAPQVDREKYLEDMEWKRNVHNEHGTVLIETFSYERVEGCLLQALAEKLAPYAESSPISHGQVFGVLSDLGLVNAFTQMLGTFLRHFKSAGLSIDECRRRGERFDQAPRNVAFLKVFEPVFAAYDRELGDRIDFEDMIIRATGHVKDGRFKSPYRYLLVDEFQDISDGRAKLLAALKAQHEDARVFAVGDDWQSIFRFAGSDIHLMRYFGSVFGGKFAGATGVHRSVDLGRTFRSVDRIATPARAFILKNPLQIEKQVIPAGKTDVPAIRVIYYSRQNEAAALNGALKDIRERISGAKSDRPTTVLLLARYHHVSPNNLPQLQSGYPDMSIRFMTMHASKGLEADHVVILRAVSDRWGFPSEVVDDPVLNMVLPEPEKFDHAEERRLFYVALTRARKSVVILADQDKPSAFVRELVESKEYGVVSLGGTPVAAHRCGTCGGRMLARKTSSGRGRFFCEHGFLCGASLQACNVCGNSLPVPSRSDPETMICSCGASFPSCTSCDEGWLVERKGRYGAFLGCVRYPECEETKRLS